jgi:hypothetical protein
MTRLASAEVCEETSALLAFFSMVLMGTWKDCIWIEASGKRLDLDF